MNHLNSHTDRLIVDQEDYLREARQRALVRQVKADRKPKDQKVRRHRAGTRLI